MSGVLVRLVDRLVDRDGRHEAPVAFDAVEPVLDEAEQRAKASAAITFLVGLLVAGGVVGPGDAPLLTGVAIALAAVAIALAQAVLTIRRAYAVRAQVTPWPGPTVPGDVVDVVDVVQVGSTPAVQVYVDGRLVADLADQVDHDPPVP